MNLTVRIPDDMATRLAEYQAGHLTRYELRQLLGIKTSHELDEFLKAQGVYQTVTFEDIQRDLEDLKAFRA